MVELGEKRNALHEFKCDVFENSSKIRIEFGFSRGTIVCHFVQTQLPGIYLNDCNQFLYCDFNPTIHGCFTEIPLNFEH